MTNVIECPSCRRRLVLQEGLIGESVQCPACATTFIAGPDRPLVPALPREQEPVPQRESPSVGEPQPDRAAGRWADDGERRGEDHPLSRRLPQRLDSSATPGDWQNVRTGLGMVLASLIVSVATAALVGLAVFMMAIEGPRGGEGISVMVGLFVLVSLATEVLTLVGYGFCLSAPSSNGARSLISVTLVLGILCLLLSVVAAVGYLEGGGFGARRARGGDLADLSGCAGLLGIIAYLVRLFTFLFFLRAVALLARAHSLVQSIHSLVILIGVAVAGYLFVLFFVGVHWAAGAPGARRDWGEGSSILLACSCIEVALLLVGFVWYIGVLVGTRRAIDARFY